MTSSSSLAGRSWTNNAASVWVRCIVTRIRSFDGRRKQLARMSPMVAEHKAMSQDILQPKPESDNRTISRRMWASSLIGALPSFLFGYCMSALNTVLATGDSSNPESCFNGKDVTCPGGSALRDLDLPTGRQEVATSLLIAGAWLGSMIGSRPSDALGRRKTLLLNNALFIVGGAFCCMATRSSDLLIGRFISGVGVGCGSGVVPVLLSEISSPRNRGAVASIHQLMINLGILCSGLLGYALVRDVDHGWRYVQGFIAAPAIAQLALAAFVPESPRWLVKHGRIAEARALLRVLHGVDVGGEREAEIERELEGMQGCKYDDQKGSASWGELWAHRRPVIIGVILMLLQAGTGINTVVFYSTTIFELAGVDGEVLATVAVGLSLVTMTSVSGLLVDKAGRRSLMVIGTVTMGVALGFLSLTLFTLNSTPHVQGWLAVCATLVFIAGFSLGMGAVTWIVLAEIVPSRIRARAFSIFTAVNWASNLFIGLFTLTAIDKMGEWLLPASPQSETLDDGDVTKEQRKAGVAALYSLFAVLCMVAVAFVYLFVRETMQKSLEELEDKIRGGENSGDADLVRYPLEDPAGLGEAGDALLAEEHRSREEDGSLDEVRRVAI